MELCGGRGGTFKGYTLIEEGGVRESVNMMHQKKKKVFPDYLEGIVVIFILSATHPFGKGV